MIEIALSLAVIGFALVAIVGILPIGMGLQKQNRSETIVNHDASVFLDAIRNGAMGIDDLTNYVMAITNTVAPYRNGVPTGRPVIYGYTPAGSSVSGAPTSPQFPLVNGYRIIGLLSTPMYVTSGNITYSNHVVAYVRSMSGPASEKFPQNNPSVEDLAFSYRLIPEITPITALAADANLLANLHEMRLSFRWPLVDTRGRVGPSQQSFRSMVGGTMLRTNEFGYPTNRPEYALYFFQPRTYVKAP
jgi:hypothetical protein